MDCGLSSIDFDQDDSLEVADGIGFLLLLN